MSRNLMLLAVLALPFCAKAKEAALPLLLPFTDSTAKTAGLGLLKDVNIPEGNREVRIWVGFGVFAPE